MKKAVRFLCFAVIMASMSVVISSCEDPNENNSGTLGTWINLGLPSGTKWKAQNEVGYYTYDEAVSQFGNALPKRWQFEELIDECTWEWLGDGFKVTGPNGNSITLPAAGWRTNSGEVSGVGSNGYYWSSTPIGSKNAWHLYFYSDDVYMGISNRSNGRSVRVVR